MRGICNKKQFDIQSRDVLKNHQDFYKKFWEHYLIHENSEVIFKNHTKVKINPVTDFFVPIQIILFNFIFSIIHQTIQVMRTNILDDSFDPQSPKPQTRTNPHFNHHQYYDCQCGKRYDAFPGLYLHFKRKHNTKISIRPKDYCYQTRTSAFSKVTTYFYSSEKLFEGGFNLNINEFFYSKLKVIIGEYQKKEKQKNEISNASTLILDKLCLFLSQKIQSQERIEEGEFMQKVPLYFNQFFLIEMNMKMINRDNMEGWKETIISFSKWLIDMGYSEYIVVKNEEFVMEQN